VLPALVLPIQAAKALVFCPRSLHSWVGSADTLQVRESLAILWMSLIGIRWSAWTCGLTTPSMLARSLSVTRVKNCRAMN
jgi:hypothetical protein